MLPHLTMVTGNTSCASRSAGEEKGQPALFSLREPLEISLEPRPISFHAINAIVKDVDFGFDFGKGAFDLPISIGQVFDVVLGKARFGCRPPLHGKQREYVSQNNQGDAGAEIKQIKRVIVGCACRLCSLLGQEWINHGAANKSRIKRLR